MDFFKAIQNVLVIQQQLPYKVCSAQLVLWYNY